MAFGSFLWANTEAIGISIVKEMAHAQIRTTGTTRVQLTRFSLSSIL